VVWLLRQVVRKLVTQIQGLSREGRTCSGLDYTVSQVRSPKSKKTINLVNLFIEVENVPFFYILSRVK
jgi:hypothetical protein